MSGRRQVRLSGELAARVEAVAESIRPRPAFSATAEMLVEDGLRARAAVARLEEWHRNEAISAQAAGDSVRGLELKGRCLALGQALRLLKGGA